MRILILFIAFSCCYATSDIDLAAQAMQKAIQTQIKYETLQEAHTDKIKDLKGEVGELKLQNLLKDLLIVALAVVRVSQ